MRPQPTEGIEEVREGDDDETETTEDSERLKGVGIENPTTVRDDNEESETETESVLSMDEMFSNEVPEDVSNEVIEEEEETDESETETEDIEEALPEEGGGSNEDIIGEDGAEDGQDYDGDEASADDEGDDVYDEPEEEYSGDEDEDKGNDYMDSSGSDQGHSHSDFWSFQAISIFPQTQYLGMATKMFILSTSRQFNLI